MTVASTLTKSQTQTYGPIIYAENGETYRITAKVRYDDQCGNGHNTFAITGEIDQKAGGRWRECSGGCLHDEISRFFPALSPFVKWHLVSSEMPSHYVKNSAYFAGERDCWGLLKGEKRVIRPENPSYLWETEAGDPVYKMPKPTEDGETITLVSRPMTKTGEGKERELDAARRAAIWPDATDEELTAPGFVDRLNARLPDLMVEFRHAMISLGFEY